MRAAPRTYALVSCLTVIVGMASLHVTGSTPGVETNKWASGPPLAVARSGATAVALGDGSVLVSGGRGAAGVLASVEIVKADGSVMSAGPMDEPRTGHAAVLLGNGRVLVVGGTTSVTTDDGASEVASNSAEIFDPLSNQWAPAGTMNAARATAFTHTLRDGRVVVGGGADSVEIYDPLTGAFSHAATLAGQREGAAVTALRDGRIVIAGGTIDGVVQPSADIVGPETGVVATVALTGPRVDATATATVEDLVLIAGGSDGSTALATTEVLDPTSGHASSGPTLSAPRSGHRAYLLPHNGGVLLVGGSNAGGLVRDSEVVIPWAGVALMTPPAAAPSLTSGAGALEGRFLVAGGTDGAGALVASTNYYGFATVRTSKDDYAPGEFVTITGRGWQPGETVNLVLHEVGTGAPDTPLNAVVGDDGTFVNDFWAPNESHLGVRFYLTATGAGATAQTTFTDGNTDFTGTVTSSAAGNPPISGAAVECTSGCTDTTTTASNGVYSVKINYSGSSATVRLRASKAGFTAVELGPFSVSNSSPTQTVNFVLTPSNAPPQVQVANATVSVDEGVAATNSGTWSDPNASDVVALSASVGSAVKAGTNAAGTWTWSYLTTDGTANSQTVTVTANDGNGGTASTSFVLTVANVAPTGTLGNTGPVSEGASATIGFSNQFDPSSADTSAGFRYAFACDNGSLAGATYAGSGATPSTSCAFDDDGSYPVKARIIDKDGGFTEYTTSVTVTNVAPAIADGDLTLTASSVSEGGSTSLGGSFADPGAGDTHTVNISWGDGSTDTVLTLGPGVTTFGPVAHTYIDDDPTGTSSDLAPISVTVTDDDGGTDNAATSVTVNNVAPTLGDLALTPNPVNEATATTLTGTIADPGTGDSFTVSINWGDGSAVETVTRPAGSTGFSASHTYADDNPTGTASDAYAISVTVSDDDTGADTESTTVTVANVSPVVAAGDPTGTANEGSAFTRNGSFNDPGADNWSAVVDYGDGSGPQPLSLSADKGFALDHTYANDGTFTITVTVTDDDLGQDTDTIEVTVKNVAPVVNAGGDDTIDEGATFAQHGSFVDPGADSWTATVNYGDGSGPQALALNADKSFALSHTYDDNGSFTVTVTVTDDDEPGADTVLVTVVNIAPSAAVGNAGPVEEGSPVLVSVSGQSDPSAADTTAGFRYSFSCSNNMADLAATYAAAAAGSSVSCVFGDDEAPSTVLARIFDKDDGYRDYTTTVAVTNVAPVKGATTFAFNPYSGVATASVGFSDAGWLDVVDASFNWAGSVEPAASQGPKTAAPLAGSFSDSYAFGPGCITAPISVTVNDDDGGAFSHVFAPANTLGLYSATFMAPLKDGARNIVKANNVIPVKLVVRDCNGAFVSDRTLSIFLFAGVINMADVVEGTELVTATSVSSADTTGIMRLADSHYMYNLSTKGLTQGLPFTIVIKDGTSVVATAVIEAKK